MANSALVPSKEQSHGRVTSHRRPQHGLATERPRHAMPHLVRILSRGHLAASGASALEIDTAKTCVAWAPDGSKLVACSRGVAQVIDGATRAVLSESAYSGPLNVAWAHDSVHLALAEGCCVRVINDTKGWKQEELFRVERAQGVRLVSWSPDGNRLAIYDGKSVSVVLSATGYVVFEGECKGGDATSLVWAPDGQTIAVVSPTSCCWY